MIDTAMSRPTEQWLEGTGGTLLVRHWNPRGSARANLVICHGFNAHSGHYARAAEAFAKRGIAVTALDLRGRGRSAGERFYIDSIDDYVSDLSLTVDLARSVHPGVPLYILGHSAGGVTAVTYAIDYQDQLDGLICESFAFEVYAPEFAIALLKGLSHIAPHLHVLRLPNEAFSRDPEWVDQLNADPLIHDEKQPVETAAALARADDRLLREFGAIKLPLLILHGTADKASKPEGSQLFFDQASSADKTLKLYQGYVHDLLNDVGRERVLNDIIDWIDDHVGRRTEAEVPIPAQPA